MDPFSAPERQNFPAFSPVFNGRAATPSSSEKHGGFRWSIDELARLKPAEIKTDPTTLAETNGHSPGNPDAEAQKAIDQFFSQRTILPSPWTGGKTAAARDKSSLPRKRVTFSPLPPATAFIRDDDSLTQSADANNTDVSTQTVLTFPIDCDLSKLLGAAAYCYHHQQQQPHSNEQQQQQQAKGDQANSSLRRKLFGQPERSGEEGEREGEGGRRVVDAHCEASMDVQSPRLSPVSCDTPQLDNTPLKLVAIGNRLSSTPLLDSPYIHKGVGPGFENPAHSSMLLSTPCNDLLGLSPIGSDLVPQGRPPIACTPTPSKGPASSRQKFVPVTPLLSPISINTQATSTPNGAVCKRELSVSPFASPVLKHPCLSHPDDTEEEEGEGEDHSVQVSSTEEDSEEIAQPLSLADLKTQTEDDLTDITPATTTCTSYFTHLGLEEGELKLAASAAALQSWQPPIHSTMLDSQRPKPNAAQIDLPSIRFVPPQQSFPATSAGSLVADSGVAASNDFNTTSAFTCSSNDLILTKSTSSSQPTADTSTSMETAAKLSSPQGAYLKIGRHTDHPTVQGIPARTRADYDSGLVFSPEGATFGKTASQEHFIEEYPAALVPLRLAPLTPHAVGAYTRSSTPRYRGSTPRATPSRLNTELSGYPSRLSSRAVFPGSSVLPSRLKLSSSVSPSHRATYGPVLEGGALYGNPGSLATANYSTPPSRYSRLRLTQRLLGSKTSLANLTDEVLRKKESLKARLQLNSPVSSLSPYSPSHMTFSPAHMTPSRRLTPLQELPINSSLQFNSSVPFSPTFASSPWQPVFDSSKPVLLH